VNVLPRFFQAGVKSWMAYTIVGEVKGVDVPGEKEPGKFQAVVEPEVRIKAEHVKGSIGFIVPLGGPLGDWKYKALHLGVGTEFLGFESGTGISRDTIGLTPRLRTRETRVHAASFAAQPRRPPCA
jgi:hypothetical protein